MYSVTAMRWTLCWRVSLLLASPSASFLTTSPAQAAGKSKADPVEVASGVRRWTCYLAERAGGEKTPQLAKNNKRAMPFWSSVKRLSMASNALERDLAAKRPIYLDALGDTRSALTKEGSIRALRNILTGSERISSAGSTAGDFFAALMAARIIDGLLWGWHCWWGPWGEWVGP